METDHIDYYTIAGGIRGPDVLGDGQGLAKILGAAVVRYFAEVALGWQSMGFLNSPARAMRCWQRATDANRKDIRSFFVEEFKGRERGGVVEVPTHYASHICEALRALRAVLEKQGKEEALTEITDYIRFLSEHLDPGSDQGEGQCRTS